jgi:hypothetical protein
MYGGADRNSLLLRCRQRRAYSSVVDLCQRRAAAHHLPWPGEHTADATSLAHVYPFHDAGFDGGRAVTAQQWPQRTNLHGDKFDAWGGVPPPEHLRDHGGQPECAEERQRYNDSELKGSHREVKCRAMS